MIGGLATDQTPYDVDDVATDQHLNKDRSSFGPAAMTTKPAYGVRWKILAISA